MPKAPAGRHEKNRVSEKPNSPKTLAEHGIDKNLADRARKACAMGSGEFEQLIAEVRDDVYRSVERAAASKVAWAVCHRD